MMETLDMPDLNPGGLRAVQVEVLLPAPTLRALSSAVEQGSYKAQVGSSILSARTTCK